MVSEKLIEIWKRQGRLDKLNELGIDLDDDSLDNEDNASNSNSKNNIYHFQNPDNTNRIASRIDCDLYGELKDYCKKKQTTISHLIRNLIEDKLKWNENN